VLITEIWGRIVHEVGFWGEEWESEVPSENYITTLCQVSAMPDL